MAFSFYELSRFLSRKVALYRFEYGPLVERFNSTDRDLTIAGNLYKAARGINHSSIRESSTSDRKNLLTIRVPYLLDGDAPEYPVTQALGNWWRPYPPSERVLVAVMTTHIGDPDEQVNIEWMGRVVGPSYTRTELTLTCDPSFRNPNMSGSIPRMQRNCGVALYSLGFGMCNLDPEPIAVPAELTAVDGNDVSAAAFSAPPRELVGGTLQWVDGSDVEHTAQILAHNGDTLTLDDAGDLSTSDAVTAYTIPYWFEATVTDVTGLVVTADEIGAATLPLAGGLVLWTRADGLQERRSIMSQSGSTITLQFGGPELAEGTVLRVYPGCAHNLAACTEHGNEINYPGFKYLPVEDPMGRSQAW